MRQFLICFLVVFFVSASSAQGPIDGYMKRKGQTDLALSFSATGAEEFIGGDETTYMLPFRGQLLGVFATHGITDKINLVGTIPFVITSSSAGLQDGALFLKAQVLRVPFSDDNSSYLDVIGSLGISHPLSNYEVDATGAIGQRAKVVQPRLVTQYNRPGFFASGIVGYNYRFDELDLERLADIQRVRPAYRPDQPADYVNALFRVGIPTANFYADAWLELQRTLGGSDFVPDVEELPQPYDVDYQQVGGTLYYSDGGPFGFAMSGAQFLGGRNTSRLWRFSLSVILKVGQ